MSEVLKMWGTLGNDLLGLNHLNPGQHGTVINCLVWLVTARIVGEDPESCR